MLVAVTHETLPPLLRSRRGTGKWAERRLILTVESIDQDPRLDPLFHAIS